MRPPTIATAPQLIGDCITAGNLNNPHVLLIKFSVMIPVPHIKHVQQAATVVFFQYKPYKNGARNAPAIAPHETPISCAMNVILLEYCTMAITADTATNITSMSLMTSICFFSSIFGAMTGFIKSMVSVELDVRTSEESVDIDAESTSMTTSPIRAAGSFSSRCGMMASNPSVATSVPVSLPKPPRK